jgi:hypothetical protein
LANKAVVVYQSIKVGTKWVFCALDEDSTHFCDGPFYVSWYDGKKKHMDPVGRDPEHVSRNPSSSALHSSTSLPEASSRTPVPRQNAI